MTIARDVYRASERENQHAEQILRAEISRVRVNQSVSERPFRQRETPTSIRVGVLAAGARNATVTRTAIGLGYGVSLVGRDVMQQVVKVASERTVEVINDYLREVQRQQNRRAGLENMHDRVANGAKQAMLASYRTMVGNKPNQGYRPRSRLTGRMYQALVSMKPRVSRDSIELVDFPYLDRRAAHWRRLNYGTEPMKQKTPGSYPLRSAEGTFGRLRDRTFPSRAFNLPAGFWTDGSGNVVPFGAPNPAEMFFPRRRFKSDVQAHSAEFQSNAFSSLRAAARDAETREASLRSHTRRSRGIKGYRFTDKGLEYLAREYPNELLAVAERWYEESRNAIVPVETTVRPR